MSTIEIKNLTFGFDNQITNLFEKTNLVLQTEWKLGLIGRNGRGKTTLLNLLQDKYMYSGEIKHTLNFQYFPQTVRDKRQSVEEVLQELSEADFWKIERELTLLNLDKAILLRPFISLSGGEQTKVLLALLFADNQSFPLIDEPTNHLDLKSRKQVGQYLKDKQQGFILVSHDRAFVDEIVDHVLSIERNQLILYQGNFTTYEEQKKYRDEFEKQSNHKLSKEIDRLQKTSREKAKWSHHKEKEKYGDSRKKGSGISGDKGFIGARAARTMKRSKTIEGRMEKRLVEKRELLKNIEYENSLMMNYQPRHHQRILTVDELQLGYDKALFTPLSFELKRGDRLVIQGGNGSGKSSILQHMFGEFNGNATGAITKPSGLIISYVSQNYEDNEGSLHDFAQENNISYENFLSNLVNLGIERDALFNRIENMSMGQRKRVEIAKSLLIPADLYVWDEPLNYLDVFNRKQLEDLIQSVKPTMLIVEHDEDFINNVATDVIRLNDNHL